MLDCIFLDWVVNAQDSGVKLLSFLADRLKGKYSARFLKRLIDGNACQINGRAQRFSSTVLGQGDSVRLYFNQAQSRPFNEVDPARILFQDDSLLIYDKPSGIVCDEKGVLSHLRSVFVNVQLIHRLDRDTTGVLLLAKRPEIFDALVKQFKNFQVEKRYLAIVDGEVQEKQGTIENFLGKKQSFCGQAIWRAASGPSGLYAYTSWERLEKSRPFSQTASLVACYPKTGRTHQIRVHMAEIGHPILGDFQYGNAAFKCPYRPLRMLLHAESIQFYHPLTLERMKFAAPMPEDFRIAQKQLFTRT